jgi:hypothetical protein
LSTWAWALRSSSDVSFPRITILGPRPWSSTRAFNNFFDIET